MNGASKRKTSFTLSRETAKTLDRLAGRGGNRSAVVERAIHTLDALLRKKERDAADERILEAHADRLNDEAADVLEYQADL